MSPFREYIANAFAAPRLRQPYFALSSCVGLVGAGIGLVCLYFFAQFVLSSFGVPFDATLHFPESAWLLLLFVVATPVLIFLGCALVAGIVGSALLVAGKLTPSEAFYYALLSRYPARWLK